MSHTNTQVDEEGFTVREDTQEIREKEEIDPYFQDIVTEVENPQIKVKIKEKAENIEDDFSDIKISESLPTNTGRRRNQHSALQNKSSLQVVQKAIEGSLLINEKINVLFTQEEGLGKSFVTGEVISNSPLSENSSLHISGLDFNFVNAHYNPLYLTEVSKNLRYLVKSNVISDRLPILKYQIEPADDSWIPFLIDSLWQVQASIKGIIIITKNPKFRKPKSLDNNLTVFINANQPIINHKASLNSVLIGDSIVKIAVDMKDEQETRVLLQMDCNLLKEIGVALQFEMCGLISDVSVDNIKSDTSSTSGKYVMQINKHV
eukprot:NODE_729_length_4743_cov_0.421619.p2 type:complete len:319 gc:universal NODE_729_length_4743_cov_0.421619:3668-4624(+)